MKLNCELCGSGEHNTYNCLTWATRKTAPMSLVIRLEKENQKLREELENKKTEIKEKVLKFYQSI